MSEFEGLLAVAESFRNAKRSFAGRALPGVPGELAQIPELIERGKQRAALYFDKLDTRLGEARYLAGERFTVADITAYCTVDFARFIEIGGGGEPPPPRPLAGGGGGTGERPRDGVARHPSIRPFDKLRAGYLRGYSG